MNQIRNLNNRVKEYINGLKEEIENTFIIPEKYTISNVAITSYVVNTYNVSQLIITIFVKDNIDGEEYRVNAIIKRNFDTVMVELNSYAQKVHYKDIFEFDISLIYIIKEYINFDIIDDLIFEYKEYQERTLLDIKDKIELNNKWGLNSISFSPITNYNLDGEYIILKVSYSTYNLDFAFDTDNNVEPYCISIGKSDDEISINDVFNNLSKVKEIAYNIFNNEDIEEDKNE